MQHTTHLQLTLAVLTALGLSGPAFAQSTSGTPAQTERATSADSKAA